jgi:hypothetical protein
VYTKSYELVLEKGDVVVDAYPLGTEQTIISIINIYTNEHKLRSFRAPPDYVVVSLSVSGNWDTGDYRAFILVGAKHLYKVPWIYPPRPPIYMVGYAIATGTGEVIIVEPGEGM